MLESSKRSLHHCGPFASSVTNWDIKALLLAALKHRDHEGRWAGSLSNRPDIYEHQIGTGDELIIIASDGLWDVVNSQEAMPLARSHLRREGNSVESCAEMLVGFCGPLFAKQLCPIAADAPYGS